LEYSFQLITGPLQPPVLPEVLHGETGAVVSFCGRIRRREGKQDLVAVTFAAYAEMAREESERIAGEIADRWPILWLGVRHRVDTVPVGEAAVWIGTAAVRRRAAYAANRYYLEALKTRLPIWKQHLHAGSGGDLLSR
jgi:molybdopterin synthase catalytic subunit